MANCLIETQVATVYYRPKDAIARLLRPKFWGAIAQLKALGDLLFEISYSLIYLLEI
jgi:hypothetical protein